MTLESNLVNIKGSPLRDEYKFQHKQENNFKNREDWKKCQGADLDFIEVRDFDIKCFTDIKKIGEKLTWIEESIIYPILEILRPVIIIETDDFTLFIVSRFAHEKKLTFSNEDYWNEFLPNIVKYLEIL